MSSPVATRASATVEVPAWLLALPAACLSAALGLYQLGDPSIWIDEASTVVNTNRSYGQLIDELHWLYYSAVAKPWATIAGTSEIAIRFPSVVGAVVSVVLVYGLARMLFGKRIAFISSVLLAVNPLVVQWSQQARGYTILLALAIAATWLFLRAQEAQTWAAWAAYGLVLVVLIHLHPFSALLFLLVHMALGLRSRPAWLTWDVTLLVSLPWLIHFVHRPADHLPTIHIPTRSVGYFADSVLSMSGALGIGVVLAAIGAFVVERHRRLLVSWAVLPFLLMLVAGLYDAVFVERYLIVSCPAFAILGAVALDRLDGYVRVASTAVTAVAATVVLVLWYSPDGSNNWAGEDWRAATEFVMRDGGAEIGTPTTEKVYIYYGGRIARTGWIVERRPWGGFAPSPHVHVHFGENLRVLRRPASDG